MLVVAQLCMLLCVAAARSFDSIIARNPSFLTTRGGGKRATSAVATPASAVATDAEYTAVGVIPSQVLDASAIMSLPKALQQAYPQADDNSCSLVMLKENSPTSISTLPRNTEMLETLSMTCHVLVLFCSNNEIELSPEIIRSILEGARRRRRLAGHDKLKLVVVLSGSSVATDETRVALALNELQDVAPQDFDAFEMTTINGLAQVWEEMISHSHDDTSELIDEEGLAKLIETIYESLSKQSCKVDLKAWKEIKFHHTSEYANMVQQVWSEAQPQLEALESKQEEIWLNQDNSVPMLEFGQEANAILQQASTTLSDALPNDARIEILMSIATKLKVLYDQQLQSLREHYGRRYEATLDNPESTPQEWTAEAQQVTEAFRAAGLNAIPKLCQEGQELVDADFSYVMALQALIADMMEATSLREDEHDYEQEENDSSITPRVAKWYEKLAARAAVLGINYLQGWMAWQAVQRAAAERDKSMPKFPLF